MTAAAWPRRPVSWLRLAAGSFAVACSAFALIWAGAVLALAAGYAP